MSHPRVIVALDYADAGSALSFAQAVSPDLCRLKIGNELFTSAGPRLVEALVQRGFDIFLDLKYHDIPNTVAQACKAAAALGVWMLNVHALGGRVMMQAAREAIEGFAPRPRLIAVTVLTSHSAVELREVGIDNAPDMAALTLGVLTQASGLDGVVCSAQEVAALRTRLGQAFLLVTPGIRMSIDAANDQKRIVSPRAAIEYGASYLVVGRPITRAADPLAALTAINAEVAAAAFDLNSRNHA